MLFTESGGEMSCLNVLREDINACGGSGDSKCTGRSGSDISGVCGDCLSMCVRLIDRFLHCCLIYSAMFNIMTVV